MVKETNRLERLKALSSHLSASKRSVYDVANIPENIDSANGVEPGLPFVLPEAIYRQDSALTEQQTRQFEEDGYFVVKNLINVSEIQEYTNHFIKLCRGEVDKQNMLLMKDIVLAKRMKAEGRTTVAGEAEITKAQDFENDEVFMKYARDSKVLQYVEPIVGNNIRTIHTMLINKPPDLGKGTSVHPMHQDLMYFPFRPCNRIVAAWTALQPITEENGCLFVVPGSHKLGIFPHVQPLAEGNRAYVGVREEIVDFMLKEKGYQKIKLEMDPGDTVFFHPCLFHGSGPNFSKKYRKAISCHFASGLCTNSDIPEHNFYVVDEAIKTMSRVLGKEFAQTVASLNKTDRLYVYQTFFKTKTRCVRGEGDFEWEVTPEDIEKLKAKILKDKEH